LEVRGPIAQAQLVETFVMNQIHLQTLLASKAARVVIAAQGRAVIDFGARRMHGTDAALKAARAFHIAGVASTSNVLAGRQYGIPLAGTMAHSYIQAHDSESAAFRAFAQRFPSTILLVDTYDTLDGVRRVIELAHELGKEFKITAVRLDSGDLELLARQARELLDEAGLKSVKIFASGGLDEHVIARLVANAPIDAFGVGTSMGVSADKPDLDIAYKLAEYAGKGRLKLSTGKPILPGAKQVFRIEENGHAVRDVIARADEQLAGRPLLDTVMSQGRTIAQHCRSLDAIRAQARQEIDKLPPEIRGVEPASTPYRVDVSEALADYQRQLQHIVAGKRH
jgi:nicotinate phosphoribosyltransferase